MEALAILLGIAVVVLAFVLLRQTRERRRAMDVLQAGEDDLLTAARRATRGKVSREELAEVLASRDALLEATPMPVLLFDRDARLVRMNRAGRQVLPGMRVGEPATDSTMHSAVHDVLSGRPPRTFEMTVYEPQRQRFHGFLRPYTARGGRGAALVLADESYEADFRDARSLFSAAVSHELRTPLARMLALVDTLALPLEEPEREETIDQMRAEIDAMRQLIEDMLLLVRLQTGDDPDDSAVTDVTAAVASCVDRNAPRAAENGMDLLAVAPNGLVAGIAPRLLEAVLDNLTENAIRHAGPGSQVTVAARGLAGAVEVTVTDTGAGIPAEHLSRIFERFYRIEGSRSGPGTGLGLAIVKHIAESHGGRATVESTVGEGTTVRVVIPTPAAYRREQGAPAVAEAP
jgi:two-component system phosphate regulon sensor histidine kinase PhoR